MDFSIIGQRIRELRKSLKLSQEELAEGICTQAQISKIEKGDVFHKLPEIQPVTGEIQILPGVYTLHGDVEPVQPRIDDPPAQLRCQEGGVGGGVHPLHMG